MNEMDNKVYAVKKPINNKWWAVIDCGKTKVGGMTVGTFWQTHFKKDGRTYRWFRKLILVPESLKEWTEIKVKEELICRIANNSDTNILRFNGWDDTEDGGLKNLQVFARLIGKEMTLQEVRELITGN